MCYNALAIESRPGNFTVLSRFLEKLNIKAVHIKTPDELDSALESGGTVSFAIIDAAGFDDSIWNYCRELRSRDIPVLIISGGSHPKSAEMFRHCAAVLKKPVVMRELAECASSFINQE